MAGPSAMQLGFPRPGIGLKVVLALVAAMGIGQALLVHWVPGGERVFEALVFSPASLAHLQVWRLLTSGVLTHPESFNHLLFSLIGLYFLAPDLERRWGTARFLVFLAAAVVFGNLFVGGTSALASGVDKGPFHPSMCFGPGAALAAVAVGWSQEMPRAEIRLFFFLPVTGRALLWFALGFAALGFVYPASVPEGVVAPFGGIVAGLLLGGSPSPVRSLLLRFRLGRLRRAAVLDRAAESGRTSSTGRRGAGSPPLRVVYGGLEEELRRRKPPKDKRYLN